MIQNDLNLLKNKLTAISFGILPGIDLSILYEGKMVRAQVLLALARTNVKSTSNLSKDIINLAAAVEIIHTATLLHDDVLDDSDVRRHKKALHLSHGNKKAILAGDFLLAESLSIISQTNVTYLVTCISEAVQNIILGEIFQANSIGKLIDNDTYYSIISKKTGALFSVASIYGGLGEKFISEPSSQINEKEIEIYNALGQEFGIIFQIVDDYLDYFGKCFNTGKKSLNDFANRKATLPLLLLINRITATSTLNSQLHSQIINSFQSNFASDDLELDLMNAMLHYQIKNEIRKILDYKFQQFKLKANSVNSLALIELCQSILNKVYED